MAKLDMVLQSSAFLFLLILKTCICQDPVLIAGMLGAYAGLRSMWKSLSGNENCDNDWIQLNVSGLNSDLQDNLFGQHLVLKQVVPLLKEHMFTTPNKALVLSFNGPPGTGKNLVSSFIAQNLFKLGVKSQFFHLYHGGKDLMHTENKAEIKKKLSSEIMSATAACSRNLFVFDEVDKMVPGVLDVLSPYIDFHEELDGVDYRNNIFIFISNAGSKNISEVTMRFLESGKKREEITLKDVEFAVARGVFHEKGGLHHSDIVNRDRIDLFVTFFPLEKIHVKSCIRAYLKERSVMTEMTGEDKLVEMISNELVYVPEGKETFARTGCRPIRSKVDLILGDLEA